MKVSKNCKGSGENKSSAHRVVPFSPGGSGPAHTPKKERERQQAKQLKDCNKMWLSPVHTGEIVKEINPKREKMMKSD